jgi:putative addiction module component (TIGR02574 family)
MQVSEILQLSLAERLQIVHDIWESIGEKPEELTLSETEKPQLDKRLESHKENSSENTIKWHKQKRD